MPYAPAVRALVAVLALSPLAAACAGPTPAPEEVEPPPAGWRVGAAEHIGLWYHGLAYALGDGAVADTAPADTAPVPRFAAGYAGRIAELKRRRGVYPTPLDERAAEFGRIFAGDDRYQGLEFLPLYFRSSAALFSGIDLWSDAGGDPRRVGSAEAARVVVFLSELFPRAAQRRTVTEWAELVREEERLFYGAYWEEQAPAIQARAAAVQREWESLAPGFESYLDYLQLEDGEIFLVPALGAEGRTVTRGTATARVALLDPAEDRPAQAVWAFAHELLYPLVGEAIREHVSPARIRELGQTALTSRSAIRGGAILLDRVAPGQADGYRRFYLDAAGREAPADPTQLGAAFTAAFPLPPELERGLEEAVALALAGI